MRWKNYIQEKQSNWFQCYKSLEFIPIIKKTLEMQKS